MFILKDYFNEIKDKKVSFLGLGVSHKELIRFAANLGITVSVRDKKVQDILTINQMNDLNVKLITGEDYLENISEDIVFRTPGISYFKSQLVKAKENGVAITSESEVFFELCPCPIIGITGSDGKTTTSHIIENFLIAQGITTHLGGNVGTPLLIGIDNIKPSSIVVAELSSFQLMSMHHSPHIAVITNLSPNHLDVHYDMEEYSYAKSAILRYQSKDDIAVLNADNEPCNYYKKFVSGKLRTFSMSTAVKNGAFLSSDGYLCISRNGDYTKVLHKSEVLIPGEHNTENYLAAMAAVMDYVSYENMVKVAKSFGGVEHRIEFVRKIKGVNYYNDSIATSPTRTVAGLKSFNSPLIIIAGGYDKNVPFDSLLPVLSEKVKLLILMGETARKLSKEISSQDKFNGCNPKMLFANNMEEAVSIAHTQALSGDTVMLSPACASFDSYPNFAVRGKHFKEIVNLLKE